MNYPYFLFWVSPVGDKITEIPIHSEMFRTFEGNYVMNYW
jgi:hypothetical protein